MSSWELGFVINHLFHKHLLSNYYVPVRDCARGWECSREQSRQKVSVLVGHKQIKMYLSCALKKPQGRGMKCNV